MQGVPAQLPSLLSLQNAALVSKQMSDISKSAIHRMCICLNHIVVLTPILMHDKNWTFVNISEMDWSANKCFSFSTQICYFEIKGYKCEKLTSLA